MTDPRPSASLPAATAHDIERLLGEFDASTISAMLSLAPTLADIEEAALWAAGEGETLPRRHHPRSVVQSILDLAAIEDEEERREP